MLIRKGNSGQLVQDLQRALSFLGFDPGQPDGKFGVKTEDAVIEFQLAYALLADGIVGPMTVNAIDKKTAASGRDDLAIDGKPNNVFGFMGSLPALALKKVPADKFADGYGSFTLREDVAQRYLDVRDEVLALGGILTSAGGLRYLSEGGGPSRSRASFHYVGRALDLALPSGMQNPATDPYVIVKSGEKWVVWCRTNLAMPPVMLEAYTHDHKIVRVSSTFFNLTEVFNRHGFKNIGARRIFYTKNIYSAAEWWHFQDETGLTTGVDTFGQQLLKIYKPVEAKKFVYWNDVRDFRFGIEWR